VSLVYPIPVLFLEPKQRWADEIEHSLRIQKLCLLLSPVGELLPPPPQLAPPDPKRRSQPPYLANHQFLELVTHKDRILVQRAERNSTLKP
jgi:hypothetical protein